MRVLLFGSTGTLGSRILLALLSHQHQVTVYVRNEKKFRAMYPENVTSRVVIATGDATDSNAIKDVIVRNKCEAVVNSAGLAAVFPWQAYGMQDIIHAVTAAAVEASQELGYPLRCWFLGGSPALDIPGTNGRSKVKDYFPLLGEHILTLAHLNTLPKDNVRWSMFCPSQMTPATPQLDFSLKPHGNTLLIGIDQAPKWWGQWLNMIPFFGPLLAVLVNAAGLNTKLEDCADWIAANVEDRDGRYVFHRVGPKESGL